MPLRVSKSFVIDADVVKAYDIARDFFLTQGYSEQSAIRPTLLALKKHGSFQLAPSSKTEDYMISLRASFNPVGDLRLYSAALLTIRCDYEVKFSGGATAPIDKAALTSEVEKLKSQLTRKVSHRPTVDSSTPPPATISEGEERVASLEAHENTGIRAQIIQHGTDIKVGEDAKLVIQIVNEGKEAVSLAKVENILPAGFQLVSKPEGCSFEATPLIIKGKRLNPSEKDEMKIVFKSFRKGSFEFKPKIIYVDENGHQLLLELEPKVFNVLAEVLPNRVTTGYEELDNLLLGGIPENSAVILSSPSIDERDHLIKKFLEAGVKNGQTTYYISSEVGNAADIAEEFQSTFCLFLCNPRADVMTKNLPNVYKLKGVDCLTDIDIALVKAFRMIDPSRSGPKRACITILSDVLLQHHAVVTRKWLSGLLADLKSKGFTTLAVINQQMHAAEEVQAILGLFEGEIRISERETDKGFERILRIRKLCNQRYLDNELTLTRDGPVC